MEDKYYNELAQIRMERAEELLGDAAELLKKGSYKSANNRLRALNIWLLK